MLLACLYVLCFSILDHMETSLNSLHFTLCPNVKKVTLEDNKLSVCMKKSHQNPYLDCLISNSVYIRGPNWVSKVVRLPSFEKLELGQQHVETHQ